MHRFFVTPDQITDPFISIMGTDVNHIKNVLRLEKGEEIIICNGQGEDYYCIIDKVGNDTIKTVIKERVLSQTELKTKLYLFQGLPKKEKMELIIQKAVELGIFEIIPVITQRTIVKIDDKKEHKKVERWNNISEAAAKQAGRGVIPKVLQPMKFYEALDFASKLDQIIIPYEKANNIQQSKEIISKLEGNSIGVFIGPEGGFEIDEIHLATQCGAQPISLGKRILRTETAGLTLLSILMFKFEED
jgi:16S rRNA (uracil1498-N3)-methyltransferase